MSADQFHGGLLPYIDNLVNLIIADDTFGISDEEFLRVLAPRGVALVKSGDKIRRIEKLSPATSMSGPTICMEPMAMQWLRMM